MDERTTRAWQLYEAGRLYNSGLDQGLYNMVEANYDFYYGNQWRNLPHTEAMQELDKPVFNILKRVTSLFTASVCSSNVAIRFEPLAYYGLPDMGGMGTMGAMGGPGGMGAMGAMGGPGGMGGEEKGEDPADVAGAEVANLLEKFKFEYRIRDALTAGAVSGDYCAHFWFDPDAQPYGGAFGPMAQGEIKMELVDGVNVIFGNPAVRDTEKQPYILLVGRDTVENLRNEARLYRRGGEGMDAGEGIQPDDETDGFPGLKDELAQGQDRRSDKALYILLYEKIDGSVHVTKATRTAAVYQDIDTGLSRYPIAWGNWEKRANRFHGVSLITGLLPNQIIINKMMAMSAQYLKLYAFPKTIYDADRIPFWSNEIGQPIGIHNLMGQNIPVSSLAVNLQAPEISGQVFNVIEWVVKYTKEFLGATDAQMGNVKPENTSALLVLQTNAEVPLENIRAGLHEWAEDIGAVLLDMMGTYYGTRPVVVERDFTEPVTDPNTGAPLIDPHSGLMKTHAVPRKVVQMFDFSVFKKLWLNLRVDAGSAAFFSEIAMIQTLDNLRRDGMITFQQYLERLPDKVLPKKDQLIHDLETAMPRETPEEQLGRSAAPPASSAGASVPDGSAYSALSAVADSIPGKAAAARRMAGGGRVMR